MNNYIKKSTAKKKEKYAELLEQECSQKISPTIEIAPEIKNALSELSKVNSQVIIHCSINLDKNAFVFLKKNTYLKANDGEHISQLVYYENISIDPVRTSFEKGMCNFSLVFEGLPKDCKSFDLIEETQELCPFTKLNNKRNTSDVYIIKFKK